MNRVAQTAILIIIALLLAGVLVVLLNVARNGVRIDHTGSVAIHGIPDEIDLRQSGPITLSMPDPVQLGLGGTETGEFPVSISLVPCPSCGGPMLPVRWNPWTGEIDWTCPACGESLVQPLSP